VGKEYFLVFFDQIISLTPQIKFRVFQAFTSLLTATTITMIVLWFYFEFGFFGKFICSCLHHSFTMVSCIRGKTLVVDMVILLANGGFNVLP